MSLTSEEVANLLSMLATADALHNTQSQEKFAMKVETWLGILGDVEYDPCLRAIQLHYADPNAKSLTPGVLRSRALSLTPTYQPGGNTPLDVERRQRACNGPGCRCTHLQCWNGFLDQEGEIVRDGRTYPVVKRCPTCAAAQEVLSVGL
jgi:hypothetical protein